MWCDIHVQWVWGLCVYNMYVHVHVRVHTEDAVSLGEVFTSDVIRPLASDSDVMSEVYTYVIECPGVCHWYNGLYSIQFYVSLFSHS